MSADDVDGLFIALDSNDQPCIWREDTPGADFPQLVMAKPYSHGPLRTLWDLVAPLLPEREVQP